ncbi:MAG TPA: hypothetical protein PKN48_16120 [Bacteroidales bacterium]|jgi:hypothetical protein|nr:hypothetical protein [Bacteroidales bacterium]HNW91186.1 hypothetical protein [Bacteroidales bacterium]HPS72634.1 hypothetical protein [Bacteroidales bacterium]
MKKRLFLATVACVFVMFAILTVNVAQVRTDDANLKAIKIMSQANAQVNPDCPNGCLDNGAGCRCNGWHPHYLDYGDYKERQQ